MFEWDFGPVVMDRSVDLTNESILTRTSARVTVLKDSREKIRMIQTSTGAGVGIRDVGSVVKVLGRNMEERRYQSIANS